MIVLFSLALFDIESKVLLIKSVDIRDVSSNLHFSLYGCALCS